MSVATIQQPVSALPLMHTIASEEENMRGTLPEGKTLEKVLRVISLINLGLTMAAHNALSRQHNALDSQETLTDNRTHTMMKQSKVQLGLGGGAAAASFVSALSFVIAPQLLNLYAGISPDMVQRFADGASIALNRGSEASKSYYEALTGEIENRRSIIQSVVLAAVQQLNSYLENQRDTLNSHCSQILQAQNRANS
jgi:hypothetical protein